MDLKGLPLGEARFAFRGAERETEAVIDLPVEIRNDVARLEIAGERSAGAVQLLDKRWRRRTVGVISGSTAEPLAAAGRRELLPARALNPFADVRLAEGVAPAEAVGRFLEQKLPMLMLADVGNVGAARERLNEWIEDGGVWCVSLARIWRGARDDLVPVRLRRGGRIARRQPELGQAAEAPAFSREGPFRRCPCPTMSR